MSDKTETPPVDNAAAKPAAAGKGKRKRLAILGVVVLVLAGGGGAAFWLMRTPAEAAEAAKPQEKPVDLSKAGIVKFEPFIVNLADSGAKRFLRVSVGIIVPEADAAKHIEESEVLRMQLRSQILDLLMTQTSERIVTPEGKAELRTAILEKAHETLAPADVHDVIFSDFVVQY